VPRRPEPKPPPELEKLLYFVLLRQVESPSPEMRDAYQRLADTASEATGWDLRTVILDWLETEMRSLRERGEDVGGQGIQLMKAAVALSNALGQ
jgi:hypothetical protein